MAARIWRSMRSGAMCFLRLADKAAPPPSPLPGGEGEKLQGASPPAPRLRSAMPPRPVCAALCPRTLFARRYAPAPCLRGAMPPHPVCAALCPRTLSARRYAPTPRLRGAMPPHPVCAALCPRALFARRYAPAPCLRGAMPPAPCLRGAMPPPPVCAALCPVSDNNNRPRCHLAKGAVLLYRLRSVELRIEPAAAQELVVRALLDDVAVAHHKDQIRAADG